MERIALMNTNTYETFENDLQELDEQDLEQVTGGSSAAAASGYGSAAAATASSEYGSVAVAVAASGYGIGGSSSI
jgi:hypothetical protein